MAWEMPYLLSNLHATSCELGYKCCIYNLCHCFSPSFLHNIYREQIRGKCILSDPVALKRRYIMMCITDRPTADS